MPDPLWMLPIVLITLLATVLIVNHRQVTRRRNGEGPDE